MKLLYLQVKEREFSLTDLYISSFPNEVPNTGLQNKNLLIHPVIYPSTFQRVVRALRGSDGKKSACKVGDLGSILGCEDPLKKGMANHFSILPREFLGAHGVTSNN